MRPRSSIRMLFSDAKPHECKDQGADELELTVLDFHTKIKLLNKAENRFEPEPYHQIKRVALSNDFATLGFRMEDLEVYQIEDPRFTERTDKTKNYFTASWMRIVFPLETNPDLRKFLITIDQKNVRVGRLLEIMDIMAGRVCYLHCGSSHESKEFTIVTASVDGIQFFRDALEINANFALDAYIGFTGSSSMEVRIDVFDSKNELYCSAYYVMVARDNVDGKAKKVPALSFELEQSDAVKKEAMLRMHLGKKRQETRIAKIKTSLNKEPPQAEESRVIHKFFTDKIQRRENQQIAQPQHQICSIQSSKVEKTVLKHYQDRNIHSKIFGGIVMRECLELAWVCCSLVPWISDPKIYFVDDIYFLRPIDIGSLIKYTAFLTYCEGCLAHVKVLVEKADRQAGAVNYVKATEFNMVMKVKNSGASVEPQTYEEAMLYLEARRRVKALMEVNTN